MGRATNNRYSLPESVSLQALSFPRTTLTWLGDEIQVLLHFFHRFLIECKQALAARTDAAHDSDALQHSKTLGDRSCKLGPLGELRDRTCRPAAELRNQREPCPVAQRSKDGCIRLPFGGPAATASARHSSQVFSSLNSTGVGVSCE